MKSTCFFNRTYKKIFFITLVLEKNKIKRGNNFLFKILLGIAFAIFKRECCSFLFEIREKGIIILFSFRNYIIAIVYFFCHILF